MAASSSLTPLVLRITYDELVLLADELDKKKERRHSKKKNHDTPEEKEKKSSKTQAGAGRKDSSGVSKLKNGRVKKNERRKSSELQESSVKKDNENVQREERQPKKFKDPRRDSSESAVSDKEVTGENTGKQNNVVDNCEECQDYELDLRARTGGVLRLSKSLSDKYENSGDSVKPRGIIRLPEGIDITNHDAAVKKQEPCMSHGLLNDNEADVISARNGMPNTEVNGNKLCDPVVQRNNDLDQEADEMSSRNGPSKTDSTSAKDALTESEQSLKQSQVKKRLKALNRQKAQKLFKLVSQTESSLSNLLSRDILKKNDFTKIKALSKEVQELYKGIMMLDIGFAVQHDVDQTLWRNGFYQVIETFRKYGKLFLGYAVKTEILAHEEINNCLKEFLQSAGTFYKCLLEALQKTHHFLVQDVVNQPRKAEQLGKNARLALVSCHHILISLGDIERYHAQFQPSQNWAAIRMWYLKASKLAPKDGKPYNQLAVVAVFAKRKLDAVYYYVRSLAVSNPILTAREKLNTIFYEIQKKADRIQRLEDEQKMSLDQTGCHVKERSPVGRGRGRGRSVVGEGAKGVGHVAEHNVNHGRHEVWIFLWQESYRRVMLTEGGQVQDVDATGEPISEMRKKEPVTQVVKESPTISLQEVNKMFILHFLCAHGFLFSKIGMEKLPALQYLLMGEFQTLLEYPGCSAVSGTSLLQITAINVFAIENTAPQDTTEPYLRVGTPQDQALNLAVDMFISLLKCCCNLLHSTQPDNSNMTGGLSAPLRQFFPAVKVFSDWMICHVELWQGSSISTHRNLWELMAQFVNAVAYLDLQEISADGGEHMVTLWEDEFLAGFKPLNQADKPMRKVKDLDHKDLVEDHLHRQLFKDLAATLVSLENPPLEFDAETGQFSSVIKSSPVSPAKESPSIILQPDTTEFDHEESDDDVIIESVEDEVDSGDEMEKHFKELKARKDALKKQVEVHKEREDKAKAVIREHISKPRLMLENYPSYLVPDTNCFVDHMNGIRAIVASQAFVLVVPLIVINELDGLKRGFQIDKCGDLQHAQYVQENARYAVEFLESEFSQRNPQVKAVTSKGSELDTIAFRSEDPSGRRGKDCNDDIILSCCLHYCDESFVNRLATASQPITIQRKVVLLTDDRNLRVKAYTRNVPVLTVPLFRKMARL